MILEREFHPDEANQAFTVARLLETGAYTYNPTDHHGPTLYYAASTLARARGENDLAHLDATTLRLTPLVFAAAALTFGFLAVRRLTRNTLAALAFAAVLATSPVFVFYATDFIQEMLLACALLGMYWCGANYCAGEGDGDGNANRRRFKPGTWALLFGAFAGFAFATKETCLLSFAAAGAGACALRFWRRIRSSRDVFFALAAFVLVAVTFFSSFGTNWQGAADAFLHAPMAYLGRAGGDVAASAGADWHLHPWWQHAAWLFGGLAFGETMLAAVAFLLAPAAVIILGLVRGARFAAPGNAFASWTFAALHTLALFALYSAIPYKTPWCGLQIAVGLAATGVLALEAIARSLHAVSSKNGPTIGPAGHTRRAAAPTIWLASCAAAIVCASVPALCLLWRDPNTRRLPYNYAAASPEIRELARTMHQAFAGEDRDAFAAVALPPEDTWPLPWYNRVHDGRTGYWTRFSDLEKLAADGAKPICVVVPMTEGHKVQPLFPHLKRTKRFFIRPGVRARVFW